MYNSRAADRQASNTDTNSHNVWP